MKSEKSATKVKWVAELPHVEEVALLGAADAAFWTDCLRAANAVPVVHDGRVQVVVLAMSSKFRGLRFQELSVSVPVPDPHDAIYLVCGFNSRRVFAWCERVFFSTPTSTRTSECPLRFRFGASGRAGRGRLRGADGSLPGAGIEPDEPMEGAGASPGPAQVVLRPDRRPAADVHVPVRSGFSGDPVGRQRGSASPRGCTLHRGRVAYPQGFGARALQDFQEAVMKKRLRADHDDLYWRMLFTAGLAEGTVCVYAFVCLFIVGRWTINL